MGFFFSVSTLGCNPNGWTFCGAKNGTKTPGALNGPFQKLWVFL